MNTFFILYHYEFLTQYFIQKESCAKNEFFIIKIVAKKLQKVLFIKFLPTLKQTG